MCHETLLNVRKKNLVLVKVNKLTPGTSRVFKTAGGRYQRCCALPQCGGVVSSVVGLYFPLQLKHPPCPADHRSAPVPSAIPMSVSISDVRSAIKSFAPGSAMDGLRDGL